METVNYEYYVSLEIAKLLKEVGFDWEGTSYYQSGVFYPYSINRERLVVMNQSSAPSYMEQYSAPTLEVAQRWLRKVKGFEIFMGFTKHDFGNGNEKAYFYDCYEIPENEDAFEYFEDIYYHSYEEAQEAGIKKALEIILKKGE